MLKLKFNLNVHSKWDNFERMRVYFSDDLNYEGLWCSDKGPKTKYSTANHMFLYFISNDLTTRRGFEFVVSGIRKETFFILKTQDIYDVLSIERNVRKIFQQIFSST